MTSLAGGMGLIGTIIVIVVAILWIILPFVVFAIRDKVAESVNLQKKILAALERQTAKIERGA